jgi:4-hydroxyphenylpyruvate dioxygenase-like putative hemolysin
VTQQTLFKGIKQIALVVHSVERTAARCWNDFGMGPWKFFTFDSSNATDMKVRGRRVDHAMRIALATIGDVELEIIEPLDDKSIYAEHLRTHGEGLHHILFDVGNYETAAAHLLRNGCPEITSGTWHGYRYAYFDTCHSLGCLTEIYSPPPEGTEPPPPERTYP